MRIELASKGTRNPKTLKRHWRQDNCPREVATDISFWQTRLLLTRFQAFGCYQSCGSAASSRKLQATRWVN